MLMSGYRSSTGREFQTDGPAAEKVRRPYVLSRCHAGQNDGAPTTRIKFPCAADNTSSSVEDTLQLDCHGL